MKFETIRADGAHSTVSLESPTPAESPLGGIAAQRGFFFRLSKRFFDLFVSTALLPVLVVAALILLVLNPFLNKGPLFFVQVRMGQHCKPFRAYKFRSMTCAASITRSADDPLETDRITPLGRFLRKSRIDELPQIFNVFAGEMSLIGPRPDFYDHAVVYVETVPGYRQRHNVLPGISGYAQTEVGYAAGQEAVRAKVEADLHYIADRSFKLDTWILWRTLCTVFCRRGA